MAWINLLEAIYPVGSIYFSAVDVSPASSVGGTWSKLTGGLLGLDGSEGIAAVGSNGGSRKITAEQMPSHSHSLDLGNSSYGSPGYGLTISSYFQDRVIVTGYNAFDSLLTGGGGLHTCPFFRLCLEKSRLTSWEVCGYVLG